MTKSDLSDLAIAAFEHAVANMPGMRTRAGQVEMVRHVAQSLAPVTLGESEQPIRGICVVNAGTGVGKSLAYAAPGIALAQAMKCRLVLSTATVALQEQILRDLPILSKAMPKPFTFASVKGRSRYFCALKAERIVGGDQDAADLFEEDEKLQADTGKLRRASAQKVTFFRNMAESFRAGTWDGDRDTLPEPPGPGDWAPVAADRHSCSGRSCAYFQSCSYFRARRALVAADVLVANHDIVLSSLGLNILPGLSDSLICFDEAHHLPSVALSTFANVMDLTSLRWLDQLPRAIQEASSRVEYVAPHDIALLSRELKAALGDTGRMILELLGSYLKENSGVCRFQHGVVPEFLYEPLTLIRENSKALLEVMQALAEILREKMREEPTLSQAYTLLYSKLGSLAPKLEDVAATSCLLLEESETPIARWVSVQDTGGFLRILVHASPISPGEQLSEKLWSSVRGAVLTSATLKSCGSFDYFLAEAGLAHDAAVTTLDAKSPFDYEKQGRFVVVDTVADPKNVPAFNAEIVENFKRDLAAVTSGALALFTSRAQMKYVLESLPPELLTDVLVQGELSRPALLRTHGERVRAGRRSIIAGLASFGTGVDLPGSLCETVIIPKLPFAPPTDPIGEARAEWLEASGRNAFEELVVPETGVKMLQWTGRAIRSETDTASVICYDRRLLRSGGDLNFGAESRVSSRGLTRIRSNLLEPTRTIP